jgi:CRISPR/Cas system-associated exonuclease Cas4 (RecB family)
MAMALPINFQFSQANLQDYTDCKRRFYYRYIRRLSWPSLESAPAIENERYMQQGAAFHQLVYQYILGIPEDRLGTVAESEKFSGWWASFLEHAPYDKSAQLFPEKVLATVVDDVRLQAKFDLIAIQGDGKISIFDWKTSRKRPSRERMVTRLQSRVYPYVLAKVAKSINQGQDIAPDQIEMIYWYPNFPDSPEVIQYSENKLHEDEIYLAELVGEIKNLEEIDQFPLTPNEGFCKYCVYRSLCDRGKGAGNINEMNDLLISEDFDLDIDFDQIAEIEF